MEYETNSSFEEGSSMCEALMLMNAVLAMSTLTFKTPCNGHSAVLLYPGILDTDLQATITKFASLIGQAKHSLVMVAGHHKEANQRQVLTLQSLQNVLGNEFGIVTQIYAENTPDQAEWVTKNVKNLSIDRIELYTPAFHLPRAYLTQVKDFIKGGISNKIVLLPRILTGNPFERMRLTEPYSSSELTQHELIPSEAKRILRYIKKGDVANLKELRHYVGLHF